MDINKKNSGWILCPSKSMRGKFYYFNVVTGEAVWSLNETETKAQKRYPNIEKADKSHSYPEPVSPPKERITRTNNYQEVPMARPYQLQSFGQAIFPKYISNVQSEFPNIIWTPIPMCPMLVTNTADNKKLTFDQNTQTFESDRDTFVQTCAISLSKRFASLGNANTNMTLTSNTNKDNTHTKVGGNWWNDPERFNKIEVSPDFQHKRKLDMPVLVMKEPLLKKPKIHLGAEYSNNGLLEVETVKNITENPTFYDGNKVENIKTTVEVHSPLELDKNDLRFLLESKRKCHHLDALSNNKEKSVNIDTSKSPKKKVRFNLENINENGSLSSVDDTNNVQDSPDTLPLKALKNLNQNISNKQWFIIVDEDILLEDFDFITAYIAVDDSCKILVPITIARSIESMGRGAQLGRDRVLAARQVYRRLNTSLHVQLLEVEESGSLDEDIINCCLKIMDQGYHIVLITKNNGLIDIAKMYGIYVYSLDDVINQSDVTSSKENRTKNSDNIFLQNIEDFDPFALSRYTNLGKNSDQSNLFHFNKVVDDDDDEEDDLDESDNIPKVFFRNIENEIPHNILYNTNDNENKSLDICGDIEKLNINDKKLTEIRRFINNNRLVDNKTITINNNMKKRQVVHDNDILKVDTIYNSPLNLFSKTNIESNKNKTDSPILKINFPNNKMGETNYLTVCSNKNNIKKITTPIYIQKSHTVFNADNYKYIRPVAKENKISIEESLKKFCIKDKIVLKNIKNRFEEWMSSYVQIMEEFIHQVLQNNPSTKYNTPYFLRDGLQYLKEIYLQNEPINILIEKILSLYQFCPKKGTIDKQMEPNDFMEFLGCGFLLIEAFKNNLPEATKEIGDLLIKLHDDIVNSMFFDDLEVETPIRRSDDQDIVPRRNFIKDKSDIVMYLKKHFVEWKNYEVIEEQKTSEKEENNKIQILRTSGKYLNTYKIDNKKRISFEIPSNEKLQQNTNTEKNVTNKQIDIDMPVSGNTFNTIENGPKVIRNINIIDKFETKLKTNLDLDALDYTESISSDNDALQIDDDNDEQINDKSLFNDKDNIDERNSTVDSGFENEVQACSLIRNFFTELSVSFKLIYNFVDQCIKQFRRDEMADDVKNDLLNKANQTHIQIAGIVEKLKSIIERESVEGSALKSLLIKAGSDVTDDKRMLRYRQTVTKCLEQAQILESSLKNMLCIITEDCTLSISSGRGEIKYYNIFE